MENDLSILTERQREVYLLRQQGMTCKYIGEELHLSVSAVSLHLRNAQRRFRQYQAFQEEKKRDGQTVAFSISRIELALIIEGLVLLGGKMHREIGGRNIRSDWQGRMPYRALAADALLTRAQLALYGKVIHTGILE